MALLKNRIVKGFLRWLVGIAVAGLAIVILGKGLQLPTSPSSRPIAFVSISRDADPSTPLMERETATAFQGTSAVLQGIVTDLDAEFVTHWQRQGLQPASQADWLTICRRLSLALAGTGMSLEEIRSLQTLPESQRVDIHRERLLSDKRFADYWAERFARMTVGAEQGPFLVYRRRRFTTWLSEQISSDRPYDQIVRQLINGKGYFTDRPEVNFITVTMSTNEKDQPDPIRLAARTARAFLGMRLDCLQCHDDFLGNVELGSPSDPRMGTQQDFHRLASFFSHSRFHLVQGIRNETKPYDYQFLHESEISVVEPAVPFAPELLPEKGTRTEQLASWITADGNRQSRRALANRIWALLFGTPLHNPIDDIPLYGPLPPGLDRLADGVGELKWNLRDLIRGVTMTRVFQMDSRAEFPVTEAHEAAWAVFPLVRLRPEQVARSLAQASRLTTINDSAAFILQLIALGIENDFVERYGDTGEDEFERDNVTITQRLLMMNGRLVRERTENNPLLNATSHIRMFTREGKTAIEAIYLAVLNRFPTAEETRHYEDRFAASENRQQAVEDLYWVLLNSSELAWNH